MAQGPGKYDAQATLLRESCQADGVVAIVLGGKYGSGFSVQITDPSDYSLLVKVLRDVANQIEMDSPNQNLIASLNCHKCKREWTAPLSESRQIASRQTLIFDCPGCKTEIWVSR